MEDENTRKWQVEARDLLGTLQSLKLWYIPKQELREKKNSKRNIYWDQGVYMSQNSCLIVVIAYPESLKMAVF